MEQRRFFEVMGEESGEWLVLDSKRHPPRVICRCRGWNAPKNAALIVAALEAHHSELYSKFPLDGSGRPNQQPAVKPGLPSSEAEICACTQACNPKVPGRTPGLGGDLDQIRSDQKPSFCSHRRTGPGGVPVSALQLAANGWCAKSFFAVTSEALGSPLMARARASFVAR